MDTLENSAPRVSVIVVTHNSDAFIARCLASIQHALSEVPHEIVIVDNASVDDTIAIVHEVAANAAIIRNSENVGFAQACNQAARLAKARYWFFLNPDTWAQDHGFGEMLVYAAKNSAAIVGPRLTDPDGTVHKSWDQRNSVCSVLADVLSLAFFLRALRRRPAMQPNCPINVRFLVGAALLIDSKRFRGEALFDERFFFTGEERDLCLRTANNGGRVVYYPHYTITHIGGGGDGHSCFHISQWINSMKTFSVKHGGRGCGLAVRAAFFFYILDYMIAFYVKSIFKRDRMALRNYMLFLRYRQLLRWYWGLIKYDELLYSCAKMKE
ncbi:MAG: glycosyltransferase [Verrucomicrobia bacterium]|jgi:GT2 family glycosyltransferase|nr:glycosyltransferase [Verrucomicrobiota bacterium]